MPDLTDAEGDEFKSIVEGVLEDKSDPYNNEETPSYDDLRSSTDQAEEQGRIDESTAELVRDEIDQQQGNETSAAEAASDDRERREESPADDFDKDP